MVATQFQTFTPDQWAQRLVKLYPNRWTSDAAKMAGGLLYKMMAAPSTELEFLQTNLDWVLDACRIATAHDDALDAIAVDYFGAVRPFTQAVKRQPGESDDSFRARIYANLMAPGGTRADIVRVVHLLTGHEPRTSEPWNHYDCACADAMSFCDVDVVGYSGRVGDLASEGQIFVESILPTFADQGNSAIYCADTGASTDRSFVLDPQPTWFMGEKELDASINRVRMGGIIVLRDYTRKLSADYLRGNTALYADGQDTKQIQLYPPASQPLVILASPSWNTKINVNPVDNGLFNLETAVAAVGPSAIDWIIAPVTYPGYGRLPIAEGGFSQTIATPYPGKVLIASPSWNTGLWSVGEQGVTSTFAWDTPPPVGSTLHYGTFEAPYAGLKPILAGEVSSQIFFDLEIPLPYQAVILPTWNTTYQYQKTTFGISVQFSTPPDADSFFYWGVLHQPY